jgi:hypothetical protein
VFHSFFIYTGTIVYAIPLIVFFGVFLTAMYLLTIRPSCLMFVAIGSVFIQSVRSHPIQANNWVKADQFGDIGSVFIQSVRSHPIQANNWFKADQFGDIISSGSGKLFEKEGHHSLSDPEHVNNNHVSESRLNSVARLEILNSKANLS